MIKKQPKCIKNQEKSPKSYLYTNGMPESIKQRNETNCELPKFNFLPELNIATKSTRKY